MIKYIEVGKFGHVYCPSLHDGRILKFYLKRDKEVIYSCEDCEESWTSLEDIFDEKAGVGYENYLEAKGLFPEDSDWEWDDIQIIQGFLMFDEIKEVVERLNIEVVMIGS